MAAYNSVDSVRSAQRVENIVGTSENIPEIKIESKPAEFFLRQRTLPVRQLFPPGIFDDANKIPLLENPFGIVENEFPKQEVILTRGTRKCLN
jgi:hypothetical protein